MSLFQSLEQAAGLGSQAGQGTAPAVLAAIVQMVQAQPGGIAGVLQKFEAAGLGGAAQSWIGAGANQPLDPGQVQNALGAQPVEQVAAQLGVSHGEAAGHIAQLLPLILDHISAGGHLSPGDSAGALSGLLARFGA